MVNQIINMRHDGRMSEFIGSRKNFVAPGSGTTLSDQTCIINETPKESSARIKSVGSMIQIMKSALHQQLELTEKNSPLLTEC